MLAAKIDDLEEDKLLEALKTGALVEIVGLTSERGKQINHQLAVLTGAINTTNGRYPAKIQHLTGEIEKVSLKPQNFNPFLKPCQEAKEKARLDFINYSSDAKVREGHGRLLDQILMLLRYAVNVMNGHSFFPGEFEEFARLSRADQSVHMANTQVFSMYRVKPSSAGYIVPGDMTILESTIHSLSEFEDQAIEMFGKMAKYEKDGSSGELIIRNAVRFMQSWDKERIHGAFWISKIVKSGTLVVQKKNEHYDGGKEPELGDVFLVKGIGSQVGSQVPRSKLPLLVRTTFLPLYNMLVYDGIMLADERVPMSHSFKEKIEQHVANAVREERVIYCGESASRGLWNTEPPEIVKPVPSNGQSSVSSTTKDSKKSRPVLYKPTSKQLSIATDIVQFAKQRGFKATKRPGMPLLIVRRMGYSKEDNPMQMVGLMYHINNNPCSMDAFHFEEWPTYTLDELLPELLKKMKKTDIIPGLIWVDEKSLVEPLRQVLQEGNDAVGFHEKLDVEWYPPPSEEEQAYHGQYSGF